jgi:FkbM family methyltransferase
MLLTKRVIEPELTDRLIGSLRPGDCFVDVGANMGYFSVLASRIVGDGGSVLAFEPCQANLNSLLRNVKLNRCRNVNIFSIALSDAVSRHEMAAPPFYNWGVATLGGSDLGEKSSLFAFPFDSLAWPADVLARISLIKIDTEGHDLNVLHGMQSLLGRNMQLKVMCELSPGFLNVAELAAFMKDLGFSGEYFDDGRWKSLAQTLPSRQCNGYFWRSE